MRAVTIEEARELLGEASKGMSDEELERTVESLELLAEAYIQSVMRGEIKIPADLPQSPKAPNL